MFSFKNGHTVFQLTLLLFLIFPTSSTAEWLEFAPGSNIGSEPAVFHNITLDDFISFDVELKALEADTVEYDGTEYLRITGSPGTRPMEVVGYPELPVVTCFVAVPDASDLELSEVHNCLTVRSVLPVYPAPLDSLVYDSLSSPHYREFFRMDSAAYAGTEWYPEETAVLSGEFRLRDQRIAVVDVYPVQYLASEDSLRVWSDIELYLGFQGPEPVWTGAGLGYYDRLIGDGLIGYTPSYVDPGPQPGQVFRHTDFGVPPPVDPDYMILVADGLDGSWIDDFADYRTGMNGFDVLITNVDDIYEEYSTSEPWPTPDLIRDYTEDIWESTPAGSRPTYLLLIGDHEDPSCTSWDPWLLPAFEYESHDSFSANDDWYVYFDEPRETDVAFPDMIVGRISARTHEELQNILSTIIDFEEPSELPPDDILQYRRHVTRLSGRDDGHSDDPWNPSHSWTSALCSWMDYTLHNYYCGDGDPNTVGDGSTLSSRNWIEVCSDEFSRGSQVVFYTDHGSVHYFECGLNDGDPEDWLGQSDSTFDDLDVRALTEPEDTGHLHPFVMMISCSQNTFNWTYDQHYTSWPHWNNYNDDPHYPLYDFGVDCFAEELMKNTEAGAIGVYGASWSALSSVVLHKNIIESLYHYGHTRTGDLIISPADLEINRYPTMSVNGGSGEPELYVTVRNAGAVASGAFPVSLSVEYDETVWHLSGSCDGLAPGQEEKLQFTWSDPPSSVSGDVVLSAEADPEETTPDSWRGNNTADASVKVLDLYPNQDGWPVRTVGSVRTPPILCNLDEDEALEIVISTGQFVEAWDIVNSDDPIWRRGPYFTGNSDVGSTIPVASDVQGGPYPEIILDTRDRLIVLDGETGLEICSMQHDPDRRFYGLHTVTVADIFGDRPGLEIALVCREELASSLSLFILGIEDGELVILDEEELYQSRDTYSPDWITALNCTPDGSMELGVTFSWYDEVSYRSGVWIYDHVDRTQTSEFIDSREWTHTENTAGIPAVGVLPSAGEQLALSRQYSDASRTPALLLDPGNLSTSVDCEAPTLESDKVLCCIMADWDLPEGQADRIIANAENQAMAWEEDGLLVTGWEINTYASPGTKRPPFPALGDLNNSGLADLLVATWEGYVMAMDDEATMLSGLGFPFTLPSQVRGGFAVADIDSDGYVEVVFGTMDNYLHVWELGECAPGYSPWPQCQHDAARTGVLLEE